MIGKFLHTLHEMWSAIWGTISWIFENDEPPKS